MRRLAVLTAIVVVALGLSTGPARAAQPTLASKVGVVVHDTTYVNTCARINSNRQGWQLSSFSVNDPTWTITEGNTGWEGNPQYGPPAIKVVGVYDTYLGTVVIGWEGIGQFQYNHIAGGQFGLVMFHTYDMVNWLYPFWTCYGTYPPL